MFIPFAVVAAVLILVGFVSIFAIRLAVGTDFRAHEQEQLEYEAHEPYFASLLPPNH